MSGEVYCQRKLVTVNFTSVIILVFIASSCMYHNNNNNNDPICKAPECQKTSAALKDFHGDTVGLPHVA